MTMIVFRFVSPALMAGIIMSSLYFMMSHWPTYTAWDQVTASGEILMSPPDETVSAL